MAEQIITKTCRIRNQTKSRQTEKDKARKRRYRQSEKGRTRQKCYLQSEKGKAKIKRYNKSKNGKAAKKRYDQSEKGKATRKSYTQSDKRRKAQAAAIKQYKIRHPERIKAKNVVEKAIRKGQLPRPDSLPCHYCPAQAKEYHHYKGYAPEHWLDVVPVCIKCHNEIPKKQVISAIV